MRAASYSPTVPRKNSRSKSLRTCEPGFARTDCDLELHLGLWGESLDDRLSAKEGSRPGQVQGQHQCKEKPRVEFT